MSPTGRLLILFVVTVCCFFLPSQGQRLAVGMFDHAAVQYAFAGMAAVFGSIGLFISLRRVCDPRISRAAYCPCMAFLIFIGLVFYFYGAALKSCYEARGLAYEVVYPQTLPQNLQKILALKEAGDRRALAMSIYQLQGIRIMFEAESGKAQIYQPTEADNAVLAGARINVQHAMQTMVTVDGVISKYLTFINIYSFTLFGIFVIGVSLIALTKRRDLPVGQDV